MEEADKDTQERAPTFDELVAMPLTEAEARVQLANLDIQLAQCQQRRAEVDRDIADITTVRAVVLRRVLNPQPVKEPSDGSGD
jgi:hypothetical protein